MVSIERPLGLAERVIYAFDKASPFNFVVSANIAGILVPEDIRRSLRTVQHRHPLLRVYLEPRSFLSAYFRNSDVNEIPLRIVEASTEHVTSELEQELNSPINTSSGPMARCALIQHIDENQTTLIMSIHHIIGDGASAAVVFRELLEFAGQKSSPPGEPFEAMPPLDTLLPRESKGLSGFYSGLKAILYLVARTFPRYPSGLAKKHFDFSENRQAHIVRLQITGAEFKRLRACSKKESTTVHGALMAALLIAWHRMIDENKTVLIGMGTPVDLRSRLNQKTSNQLSFLQGVAMTPHIVRPDTPFWLLARDAKNEIANSLERGDHISLFKLNSELTTLMLPFLSLFKNGARYFGQICYMSTPSGTGISNLGMAISSQVGGYTINSIEGSVGGSAYFDSGTAVLSVGDVLSWTFVGMNPVFSREQTERLAKLTIEILEDACQH